jgi:superfamily I DNA/RNA helicase
MIAALMNAVKSENRNLLVVGDPAQTINSYTSVDAKWQSHFTNEAPVLR